MTTNQPAESDDLIAQVVDAFERMSVPPPPRLAETSLANSTLANNLPGDFRQAEKVVATGKPGAGRDRPFARRPLARILLATAACLAIAGLWQFLSSERSAAQVLAMFAKALPTPRVSPSSSNRPSRGSRPRSCGATIWRPEKMRSEMEGFVQVIDMQAGKILVLYPLQKTAELATVKLNGHDLGALQSMDIFQQLHILLADAEEAKLDRFEPLGEKQIDGRPAIGFRYVGPLQSATLWGDPATGQPVLVELESTGIPRSKTRMSHFVLNEKLDTALFAIAPPADYQVDQFDVDVSDPSEALLVKALRTIAGWNEGRFCDQLDVASVTALAQAKAGGNRPDAAGGQSPPTTMRLVQVAAGLEFAASLPESANAHYAGQGVKLDAPNRPIFWYQPEDSKAYRVIYADLSVRDAVHAPAAATLLVATDPTSTFQAFNLLAEPLIEAKSGLTFVMEINVTGQIKQKLKSYYLATGKMCNEALGAATVSDIKSGKVVTLLAAQKMALVMNIKLQPAEPGKARTDDWFEQIRDLLSKSRDAKDGRFTPLGEKEIDGRSAIGFSQASTMETTTLWGDPATGLPVLVEWAGTGNPRTTITMSHFELNEDLQPELFDTTPPATIRCKRSISITRSRPKRC